MNIYDLKSEDRTPFLIEELTIVWEKSVKSTHSFLSIEEIKKIKTYIPDIFKNISRLIIMKNTDKHIIAFMGIDDHKIEMLFVVPEEMGKGVGKKMIQYGINNYSINEVTVNEQNLRARGFYEHMGFKVYKRTDCDEQGNPYPLLYMVASNKFVCGNGYF